MKRVISLAVSLFILAFIYSKIDFAGLIKVFQNCHVVWMAVSLGMVIPLTMLTSWRLQQLMPTRQPVGFWRGEWFNSGCKHVEYGFALEDGGYCEGLFYAG